MIRSHFRTVVLVLLILLAGVLVTAQDDTPITISDGSLTIRSVTPWASYTATDSATKTHPQPNKSVTKVTITMPGHNQVIDFSGERCTVSVAYADTNISFGTKANGRGLSVVTNFSAFNTSGNTMTHKNTTSKISRVVVFKNGASVFDNTASGGTQVVISYQ